MAWLLLANANNPSAHLHFIDVHSLLNLSPTTGGESSTKILSFQASAVKSGFMTSEEALITTSFKFELPTFFGWDNLSNKASSDTRVPPVIKAHEEWGLSN